VRRERSSRTHPASPEVRARVSANALRRARRAASTAGGRSSLRGTSALSQQVSQRCGSCLVLRGGGVETTSCCAAFQNAGTWIWPFSMSASRIRRRCVKLRRSTRGTAADGWHSLRFIKQAVIRIGHEARGGDTGYAAAHRPSLAQWNSVAGLARF